MNKLKGTNLQKAFTLIELLIVISIIGILVAAATVSWRNAQMKGRDGKRKADLKAVQQALETFLQTNGVYPSGSAKIKCTNSSPDIEWGSTFSCNSNTFMQTLTKDPVNVSPNVYTYILDPVNPFKYKLYAFLENTKDPDLNPTLCGLPPGQLVFCVTNP